jgi:hypothetical protein
VTNENSSGVPLNPVEPELGNLDQSEGQKKTKPWFLDTAGIALFAGLALLLILFELLPR